MANKALVAVAVACVAPAATSVGKFVFGWVRDRLAGRQLRSIRNSAETVLRDILDEVHLTDTIEQSCDEVVVDANTNDAGEVIPVVKLRVRHRGSFQSHLVSIGKAKFGCPSHSAANVLCVRKYLHDYCVEHHVLPRHIATLLASAVEAVFVPWDGELVAMAIRTTAEAKRRRKLQELLGESPPTC